MRMRQVSSLFVALLVCGTGQAADVDESAPGWCAAAAAPVQSRATIFCSDVEAAALGRLNELLDAMRLTFVQKRAQAEPWARQYRDLKQRLNLLGDNDAPLPVVQRLVADGRFEEASALLEDTLNSRRLSRSQRSEYRFAVARTLSLQFRQSDALPYYAGAFRESPDTFAYAFSYAEALREGHRDEEARAAYQHALATARRGAASEGSRSSNAEAMTLTSLATLSRDGGRAAEAEQNYRRALQIYHDLRDERYTDKSGEVLNHLGVLYHMTEKIREAELAYQEALTVYRSLAQANAPAYLPDVAGILHNLTLLYRGAERRQEAQWVARAEHDVYRGLVRDGYAAYIPELADTLNSLGVLYHTSGRLLQAESAYRESVAFYRGIVQYDPAGCLEDLAGALNNLGVLYRDTQRMSEARRALREAAQIRSDLASRKPRLYTADLVQTLANLQKVYRQLGWTYEAGEIAERLEKLGVIP